MAFSKNLVVLLVSVSSCVSAQQVAGVFPRTSRGFTYSHQLSPSHTVQNTLQPFNHLQNVVQYSFPLQNGTQLISPSWPFSTPYFQSGNLLNPSLPVLQATDNLFVSPPSQQTVPAAAAESNVNVEQARSFAPQPKQTQGNGFFNIIPADLFAQATTQRPFVARPFEAPPANRPTLAPAFRNRKVPVVQSTPSQYSTVNNIDETPILRYVNEQNNDGSYTYGFESADGTYKIETRLSTGEVVGKYGYLDSYGQLKEVTYGAGTDAGFVPSVSSSDTIPEDVGIEISPVSNFQKFPVAETARGQPSVSQDTAAAPELDSQESEVLSAFSSLMEVARGFKPAASISQGFRASIPTTQTPFFRSQPRPSPQSTTGPKLPTKIRNNPKARGFSLSQAVKEISNSVEEDLTTDNKVRVVNGKRLLMKRRRKPSEQSTSETTTTLPQFENHQFNTIQTESDVDNQLQKAEERRRKLLETESRRRLSFPPRDFMQRLSTDNNQRNSKALDRKRFVVRRKKQSSESNETKTLRSSGGRSVSFRSEAQHHTNAHQDPHPSVSNIDMSTGSYSISYGR